MRLLGILLVTVAWFSPIACSLSDQAAKDAEDFDQTLHLSSSYNPSSGYVHPSSSYASQPQIVGHLDSNLEASHVSTPAQYWSGLYGTSSQKSHHNFDPYNNFQLPSGQSRQEHSDSEAAWKFENEASNSHASSNDNVKTHQTLHNLVMEEVNPISFDMMASLNFPIVRSGPKTRKIPFDANEMSVIAGSSIDYSKISKLAGEDFFQKIKLQDFYHELNSKNLAFLLCIHKPWSDERIAEEVKKTSDWLLEHHFIKPTETSTEADFREWMNTEIAHHLDLQVDADFKARQARIILNMLGTYYKTVNLDKWNKFFDCDD